MLTTVMLMLTLFELALCGSTLVASYQCWLNEQMGF